MDKSEIIIETLRALIVAMLLLIVWRRGRREFLSRLGGWYEIIGGVTLLLFASVIDVTDNFPELNRFVVVGDTSTESFLEKVVGYTGGYLLLFIGFWKWLPLAVKYNMATTELMAKTAQLEDLAQNLEKRVEDEVALRRKGEDVIFQQLRLSAMGEMLGAIAHQWRQPLNTIGLIIQNLGDAHEFGQLDAAYIEMTVQKSMTQIKHMSKMIDDFRNFILPDREKTTFDAMESLGKVIELFSAQLAENNIDILLICQANEKTFGITDKISHCAERHVRGFRNEFEHAVINLLNNSREAILEQRVSGPNLRDVRGLIRLELFCTDESLRIGIVDNGGGVPVGIIDRIYEPYFTTKDQANGTGLGLYMSKVIVEEHMGGTLTAANEGDGAVFTISLRLMEESKSLANYQR